MKIGIIACEDADSWGGEKGISEYIISKFKEIDGNKNAEYIPIYAVSGDLPTLDDSLSYDGFLISGSHHSVNNNESWVENLVEFVSKVLGIANGPCFFGICFGHQLIAKALNGRVGKNPKKFIWGMEEVHVRNELRSKAIYCDVFGSSKSFSIMQSHGECITSLPSDAVCLGSSSTCQYEILMYGNRALTMQGHPELTNFEMVSNILPRLRKAGILNEEQIAESIKSMINKDHLKLMKLVKKFFISNL